jgi:hypothetical protein
LQRNDISQFDRDMYNSNTRQMFESFSRFVSLHYLLSHRNDSEYWRNIKNQSFPDSLDEINSPYLFKIYGFNDLIDKYLNLWHFPFDNAGITYIATGMRMMMMNQSRVQEEINAYEINPKEIVDRACTIWEKRKKRWDEEAKKSPILYEYLKKEFYDGLE